MKPNALTLIVMDYSGGARAELDPQVRNTLVQLLQRQQRAMAISTMPEGQQIVQELYDGVQPIFHNSSRYGDYFLNLGYKASGEAAIRSLMQNSKELFAKDAIKNKELSKEWENFQTVKSLNDVTTLILFSDNAKRARQWVEQVAHPSGKPLLVGVTAEAAPELAPYRESKDIKVMLTGLRGAADYEYWLNNPLGTSPATASGMLDAISYVSLLLVGVMVAGYLAGFVAPG